MLAIHGYFLWTVRGRIARGDPDFTAFYTAGKILREGRGSQLYDPDMEQAVQREFTNDSDIRRGPLPYVHPPFEALVFLPLSLLPYLDAFVLWNVLSLAMLVAVSWMMRNSLDSLRQVSTVELVLACLAFFPVFANFHQGQDAILLLLLFTLAYRALGAGAETAAGCWLGLGLFRYHLAIPAVLILTLWGYRKLLRSFTGVALGTFLVSVAVSGWHAVLKYPEYTWRWASIPGIGRTPPSLMPSLFGLIAGWSGSEDFVWPLRLVVWALSAALLIWAWSMRGFESDRRVLNLGFAFAVIVTVLLGYNTSTYDVALLVLPLALVGDYCLRELRGRRSALLALTVPVIPLVISPIWFLLWLRWQKINLLALFLLWWAYAIWAKTRRMRSVTTQPALT